MLMVDTDFTNTVPERLSDPDGAPIVDASSRLKQEAQDVQALGVRRVRDVTEDFTLASNQLESGELVKDDFFTLFEAVSALEVSLSRLLVLSIDCLSSEDSDRQHQT